MLSVLTVILRYIRCTALNWVELVLDCDVIWCGQMKTRFAFSFTIHGPFLVTLRFLIYFIYQIHSSL